MDGIDAIWNATVEAVLPLIQPTVIGLFALLSAWIWKRVALIKAATKAATQAERKHGPGAGEKKREHAKALLRQTISGKMATLHGMETAIDGQDFVDIRRRASMAPKPPKQ